MQRTVHSVLWAVLVLTTAVAAAAVSAGAAEVAFRRHRINPDSEFSSCAAIDVNRDGKLDLVCGGFWYEGPTWRRHVLREVEAIRGRFDDYSNLPLDVNGDGWLDLVSVNYRSQSLYWVEHPGAGLGLWQKHAIDTPGPSESGRTADIDGDGRLDVLPNGTTYAAWYELVNEKSDGQPGDGESAVRWLKHDLPEQLAGHGLGFGDLDGDGRGDLVGPKGWAQAPAQPRTERWTWHDEFTLHRDGSIPILVHDVDGDGDRDVIWGRGHNIGLYWLEQQRDGEQRRWIQHAIDTSWSQAHAILLADIDGDGRPDLVAGKRYLGHDGNDPGEYDPLGVYWYSFDPAKKTWRRQQASWGETCGFDLDPKTADIDGDGDLDLLAPTRKGFYLLENLRIDKTAPTATDTAAVISSIPLSAAENHSHTELSFFLDGTGARQPLKSSWDWGLRRVQILEGMERAMGPLPGSDRRVPLDVQVLGEEETEHYVRRRITFASEPGDRVPAFLLVPKNLRERAPAMLCLHPTSPLGKAQICGLDGKPTRFYAHELANRGFVCLAPDYPGFGDLAQYDFQNDAHPSGTMKAIWNHIRGVDLLESLPEVAADRIGVIGHSLGGHNALFVAAFDQRLRAVVTSCGFNAFEDYYEGNLKGWTSEVYMPRIRDEFDSDPRKMPFDFHEVLAAVSPRPVFINAPLRDSNFAVAGVKKAVTAAAEIYKLHGAEPNLHPLYPDTDHDFPDAVREQVYQWLADRLKP